MGGAGQKRYYPAFVDLEGRLAVVVGQGEAAESKAERLSSYGADVVVITESPTERLTELESEGRLTLEDRAYADGDLQGAFLVVCVADDPDVRERVVAEANSTGALLSVKGAAGVGNHILPSVIRRGALQIAISTAGVAPAVAHRIKAHIAADYGPEWGPYLELLAEVRAELSTRTPEERTAAMAAIVDSDVLDRVVAGQAPNAASLVEEFAPAADSTEADSEPPPATGEVPAEATEGEPADE